MATATQIIHVNPTNFIAEPETPEPVRKPRKLKSHIRDINSDCLIGMYGCLRVIWLTCGKGQEHISPRLYKRSHALRLLDFMQAKHGKNNAKIYVD